MRLDTLVCTALLLFATSACHDAVDQQDRSAIGKADLFGSCASEEANFCGEQSDGNCWCDDDCETIGDCCGDKQETCGAQCPSQDDPKVFYQNDDPETCATLRFACSEPQTLFSDECGCGCICPTDDPAVHYKSEDPEQCAVIRFSCDSDQTLFSNDCGCGCIDD